MAKTASGAVDMAKDAVPAAGAVGAAAVGGSVFMAPTWLIGLGQAVIVVFFTLRGVERKMRDTRDEVNELRGALTTLAGRFEASCANPQNQRRRITDRAPCEPDSAWVE